MPNTLMIAESRAQWRLARHIRNSPLLRALIVEKEGVTWTQARTESIKVWYDRRFQIVAWPTMILLDPNGKILSVDRADKGELGLRGDKLAATLGGLFAGK